MDISVNFFEDARLFSAAAGDFLFAQPVLHNLLLTILDQRKTRPEPGRYWAAMHEERVVGIALQSPVTYPAVVAPMEPEVAAAIVDAITDAGIELPGVNGMAATAAAFAGHWTERHRSAASPTQGVRLYELQTLNELVPVAGELRRAARADREIAVEWLKAFSVETATPSSNPQNFIDTAIAEGRLWLWQSGGGIVSMCLNSNPLANVARISAVYTPPEHRGRGYAGACVHGLSRQLVEAGQRCILYTDLGNPISNSIYRRIGYRAVSEGLKYSFSPQ